VDWIRLAQDRDRWRAVVSAVMNLRILAPRSDKRIERANVLHDFNLVSLCTKFSFNLLIKISRICKN
jgi:hypothetical protein